MFSAPQLCAVLVGLQLRHTLVVVAAVWKKSVCLSVCDSVCLSVCLFVSVCTDNIS